MTKFKSEASLRRTFVQALRKKGIMAQPIESAGTARGIGDIYFSGIVSYIADVKDLIVLKDVEFKGRRFGWIELKNMPSFHLEESYTIPYRGGQLSWLSQMAKHGTPTYTLIALADGIKIIDHAKEDEIIQVRSIDEAINYFITDHYHYR